MSGMEGATIRAMLEQHFTSGDPDISHAMYQPDAVVEFPQSGEHDGGPWSHGVSILKLSDEKIARETIYVAEGWEAPEWRAQWRSAP